MSGAKERFMPANWASKSKSVTERTPRSMALALCATAKSRTKPLNGSTLTLPSGATTSRTMSRRSSRLNMVFLWCATATATTTLPNRAAPRRIRSWWPRVMGSKVPG